MDAVIQGLATRESMAAIPEGMDSVTPVTAEGMMEEWRNRLHSIS